MLNAKGLLGQVQQKRRWPFVVGRWQDNKQASQTRDRCVAQNATLRAARPDPSLRKRRLLRMTIELYTNDQRRKTSRPTGPCGGPRMNRRKTCGNPPRPFRRLRVAEHGTPDLNESGPRSFRCWFKNRLPPSPTSQAGFQFWMLGKNPEIRKRGITNSWYSACQRLWLPGAALILEHFIEGVRKVVGALQVFNRSTVVIALQEMIFVGNIQSC
jgi:hypothetical protein